MIPNIAPIPPLLVRILCLCCKNLFYVKWRRFQYQGVWQSRLKSALRDMTQNSIPVCVAKSFLVFVSILNEIIASIPPWWSMKLFGFVGKCENQTKSVIQGREKRAQSFYCYCQKECECQQIFKEIAGQRQVRLHKPIQKTHIHRIEQKNGTCR